MYSSRPLIVATLALAMLTPASSALAATETFYVVTDSTWRSFNPNGDQTGTPINSVGGDFESINIGWNTAINFDDSTWGTSSAIPDNEWGGIIGHGAFAIWTYQNLYDATSPAYFRKLFAINQSPLSATLSFNVDDDAIIYINGNLAAADTDGIATYSANIDVTPYLVSGVNLIAVKAHDSYGGLEGLKLALAYQTQPVPEPETYALMLAGLGLVGFAARRRRSA